MIVDVHNEYGGNCADYTFDLSPILTHGVRFAVKVDSKDEASALIAMMKEAFPSKCESWSPKNPSWDEDYHRHEGGVAYFLDVNHAEDLNLEWCSVNYAKEYGYTVVSFPSLLVQDELLSEDAQNISGLFDLFQIK